MIFTQQDKTNQAHLSQAAAEFLNFAEEETRCRSLDGFADFYQATTNYMFPLQAWPTLVRASLVKDIAEMTLSVDRLVKTVFDRVFHRDLDRMCDFYNVDERDLAAMVFMEPTGIESAISRQDCLLTTTGPKCLEMNCGSFVGAWEISCVGEAITQTSPTRDFIQSRGIHLTYPNSLRLVLDHLIASALELPHFRGRELNIAITTSKWHGTKATKAYLLSLLNASFKSALSEKAPGLPGTCIFCTTSELKTSGSKLYAKGKQIHALFEQHDHVRPNDAFRCAKAGHLALFSGPITLFLSDKRNLALLSINQETELYSESDRQLIRKYIPWTRILTNQQTDFHGHAVTLQDFVLNQRQNLVIKAAQSSGGNDVLVGRATTPSSWEKHVGEALKTGRWIVQEFLESPPLLYMDQTGSICPQQLVLGMFAIGGQFGGGVIRVMPVGNADVVNVHQGANLSLLLIADS